MSCIALFVSDTEVYKSLALLLLSYFAFPFCGVCGDTLYKLRISSSSPHIYSLFSCKIFLGSHKCIALIFGFPFRCSRALFMFARAVVVFLGLRWMPRMISLLPSKRFIKSHKNTPVLTIDGKLSRLNTLRRISWRPSIHSIMPFWDSADTPTYSVSGYACYKS